MDLPMSLVLIEDHAVSFGDLIVSCWDETSRISVFTSARFTLDECMSLGIKAFECQHSKKPKYASLHAVQSIDTAQTLGVYVD